MVTKKYERGEITFRQCPSCGSWLQSPALTVASLSAWFDAEEYRNSRKGTGGAYLNYFEQEAERQEEAQRRYDWCFAPYLKPNGSILEVGCATGSVLSVLRGHGHAVTGVEIAPSFADFAREKNSLAVETMDILAYEAAPQSYDMVILLGILGNFPDALAVLSHVRPWLKPGGILFFNFPAADALVPRLYGEKFWMFAPSANTFFSRDGARKTLQRAGYRIVRQGRDRQSPTLSKLLGHSRLFGAHALVRRLGIEKWSLPLALPIPGIYAFWATPDGS